MMMKYFLFVIIIAITSCQRRSVPEVTKLPSMSSDSLITLNDNEIKRLTDVQQLLRLSQENSGKIYDSVAFQIYFNSELGDSIKIQDFNNDTVYISIGNNKNRPIAIYSYLDILGYRFYGPEDHWTYIPKSGNKKIIDTTVISYFPYRILSPSYGVRRHNIPRLDTTGHLFSRWITRLRFGNLINIPAAHYGSTFNRKYRKEIQENPLWRGTDNNGDPKPWHINLKLCYTHPEVIDLYKRDAELRLKELKSNSHPPYVMSMEPPDGDGFCNCDNCNFPINEQIYRLANIVAKHISQLDSNAYVSLYGYNKHAKAPSFKLEENVIVGIVPYAFQSVGSPEAMMKEWESTGATLYLRDYLAIPDWSYDQPTYLPGGFFLNKINHIKNAGYLGYAFETTASFMSVGLQFYLLSQASWKKIDEQQEYQKFLDRLFPGIQEQVDLIFQALPSLNSRTYGHAVEKLDKLVISAENHGDSKLTSRLHDLKFYIEYLYLLDQFNKQQSDQNTEQLMDKILSSRGIRLLHPYGLYRSLQRKKKFERSFKWTENVPVSIPKLEEFELRVRRNHDPKYVALHPEFYVDSVLSFEPIPIRNTRGLLYVGAKNNGLVRFRARVKRLNSSAGGIIIIRDESGNHIKDIIIPTDNKWRDYEINLAPNKFYKVQFRTPGAEMYFQGPNRPFVFTEPLYHKYLYKQVPYFFYVPDNVDNVKIEIPHKSNTVTIKVADKILIKRNNPDSYVIDLENQNGNIIEVLMPRHGLKLLNIPHYLALHPDGVITE